VSPHSFVAVPRNGRPAARRRDRRWLWLLAAVLAAGILGLFAGENSLPRYWRLGRQQRVLEEEVARLRAQEAALEHDLSRLDSDPELLERIAREVYHLRRPDEQVLELVPAPAPDADAGDSGDGAESGGGGHLDTR